MQIEITPQQRLQLYNLVSGSSLKLKGQEARRFRRFSRHLGFDVLAEAEAKGKGNVSTMQARNTTPAAFEVDADTVDRLFKISEETERTPSQEQILGPLFDVVDTIKTGGAPPAVTAPPFSETVEMWLPPKAELQAPEDKEIDLIVAFLKANPSKTPLELAELIDRGDHRPD